VITRSLCKQDTELRLVGAVAGRGQCVQDGCVALRVALFDLNDAQSGSSKFFSPTEFTHCRIPKCPKGRDLQSVASSENFIASWATNAYNKGGWQSLQTISRYLGHRKLATTEVYLKRGLRFSSGGGSSFMRVIGPFGHLGMPYNRCYTAPHA